MKIDCRTRQTERESRDPSTSINHFPSGLTHNPQSEVSVLFMLGGDLTLVHAGVVRPDRIEDEVPIRQIR